MHISQRQSILFFTSLKQSRQNTDVIDNNKTHHHQRAIYTNITDTPTYTFSHRIR